MHLSVYASICLLACLERIQTFNSEKSKDVSGIELESVIWKMDQSGGVILAITISYMGPKSGGDITQAGAKKMLTYISG